MGEGGFIVQGNLHRLQRLTWFVEMTNRTMFPSLKNNAAAGYKGPVKIELLKGTGPYSPGLSFSIEG